MVMLLRVVGITFLGRLHIFGTKGLPHQMEFT
jgi:hypothetical protein